MTATARRTGAPRPRRTRTNWLKVAVFGTTILTSLLFLAKVIFPMYIAYEATGKEQSLSSTFAADMKSYQRCFSGVMKLLAADNKDKKNADLQTAAADVISGKYELKDGPTLVAAIVKDHPGLKGLKISTNGANDTYGAMNLCQSNSRTDRVKLGVRLSDYNSYLTRDHFVLIFGNRTSPSGYLVITYPDGTKVIGVGAYDRMMKFAHPSMN